MAEYVLIQGVEYPVDTEEQQTAASAALSAAGINSTRVWKDGVSTERLILADTDVDPVENGTAPSLATILETIGVKSLAVFVGFRAKSPENDWPHFEWLMEITRGNVTIRTPFKQGIGNIKPMPKTYRQDRPDSVRAQCWLHEVKARIVPSPASVISTLIASSSGSDQTFQDWCSDAGYSDDSRKALDTYLACQVELMNLRRLLGQHFNAACEAAREE